MADRKQNKRMMVGLVGQQNAGKSTTFNMLTGARQHVANYPGVTVEKKSGFYRWKGDQVEVVDLPGTYSLTSFSLEERVARGFLLVEKPEVLVNVVDATALRRSLYFTFQLLEMGFPVVVALNMIDVAASQGIEIDIGRLQHRLGLEVIPTIGRKGVGKEELRRAIQAAANRREGKTLKVDYQELEGELQRLEQLLDEAAELAGYPSRWLAVRLLEGDAEMEELVGRSLGAESAPLRLAKEMREQFEANHYMGIADHMVVCRDQLAESIVETCLKEKKKGKATVSEIIDRVVLNRYAAPVVLIATVFTIYQLSIVKGYDLTQYWWPVLAQFRTIVASLLPAAGMLEDPYVRAMGLWMVDSANALLNYIPIFLILFALIAILEDSGYMARIAFILDRLFYCFGLHGQSTLPYILGGVFAGGCAVPGVMATKGIPDEQSRMATILTVPYMNCLAKIPFYTLLINVFFAEHKSWAMLFLSTITIFFALLVARLLTVTVLRSKETAPFVMELPNYHPPTLFGVGQRAIERTWQYIKKVGTIVIAISVIVFALLQFPGLSDERLEHHRGKMAVAVETFLGKIAATPHAERFGDTAEMTRLANLYSDYRAARLNASGADGAAAVDHRFAENAPDLFVFLKPQEDKDAQVVSRALRGFDSSRRTIRREIKEEQIESSLLGMVGRGLEPLTQWAGFNWKINVAILSSFAARESSVATVGALYQQGADESKSLEERMGTESISAGFTPLHALAVIVFFALYPPCLATTIMIKVQTGSYKWMAFSIFFPTLLGFVVAAIIFTGGNALQLNGIQMMGVFYALVVGLTLVTGLQRIWRDRTLMPVKLVG
jgi:ferrous iron transport protein B